MTKTEENKKEMSILEIPENILVKDLAEKMDIKVTDLIAELIKNKVFVSINEAIDFDTAAIIADDFGFELVKVKSEIKNRKQNIKRNKQTGTVKKPPVVVIMGHVDHGKTTLLDKILQTNIAAGESGGITQHTSAYQVEKKGEIITFLDTPGHEAFHSMRQRGAYLTDLAVIVIAADDGVKPQTIEAVNFARNAEIPILVAINKTDKSGSNTEKVKTQLSEIDLSPEDWGGKTVCVEISAKNGNGIDELLDMIIIASDMEEIKANPNSPAEGFVIESHLDPKIGPVSTVLIQNGTLKEGDYISVGSTWGRVKKMKDFMGKKINKATPSMPVKVMGINEVSKAGSSVIKESSRLDAEKKVLEFLKSEENKPEDSKLINTAKIKELVRSNKMKKLNLILKADTKGSLEAVIQILESIKDNDLAIQILKSGVGNITGTDIKMAISSNARIVGFNVIIDFSAKKIAEKEKIDINIFKVIYELVDYIKGEMTLLFEPQIVRTELGELKVIALFKSDKKSAKIVNMIFGSLVEKGKVKKTSLLEIVRNGEKIGNGKVKELQYNKKEVKEVKKGNNAGITFEGNVAVEMGDVLKAYEEEKMTRKI